VFFFWLFVFFVVIVLFVSLFVAFCSVLFLLFFSCLLCFSVLFVLRPLLTPCPFPLLAPFVLAFPSVFLLFYLFCFYRCTRTCPLFWHDFVLCGFFFPLFLFAVGITCASLLPWFFFFFFFFFTHFSFCLRIMLFCIFWLHLYFFKQGVNGFFFFFPCVLSS